MSSMIFKIANLIYTFIYLNILWLLFFLLGFGILGFMPATLALFSSIRDWLKEGNEVTIKKYFYYYKTNFFKTNVLGIIFYFIFFIIYANIEFVPYFYPNEIHLFLYIIIGSVGVISLLTFVNLFSIMAHFHYSTFQYVKVAIGFVFYKPFKSLLQLMWIVAYLGLAIFFPTVFIVIGISVISYVLMATNYSLFNQAIDV
ncbi:YesL family protein [Halalkalibacter sp. AB-rgal2]|uniref:YesL family protein n=1 Tax=Halalkalibacter sp. AB-rgal2 TaxID=3242695 RepID=UPI00359D3416